MLSDHEKYARTLRNSLMQPVRLAASVKWFEFPEKFDIMEDQLFAFEYTPDSNHLDLLPIHIKPYLERGVEVRHHAFFPGLELADVCDEKSSRSLALHLQMFDIMAGLGEMVVTVHVGLNPQIELCSQKAVDNLCRLVDAAGERGITVSLENLRRGLTSNPHIVLDWAKRSGSAITLDLGHVLSSDFTQNGGPDILEVIRMFKSRLVEVHFYEKETDRHYPPGDMTILGPVVDALLKTECNWWTIELVDPGEIELCRKLIWEHNN
jgi:sugar phosphate isomerase/epimerase